MCAALLLNVFAMLSVAFAQTAPTQVSSIQWHYRPGERLAYRMQAVNQGHLKTVRYEAKAQVEVQRGNSGFFVEPWAWTALTTDGEKIALTPASSQFREQLSLAPEFKLAVPDLSRIQPALIGPVVDTLTFYADVQLAMRQTGLQHVGDRTLFHYGVPNSWADGTYTLFGQDAVDFDITLAARDSEQTTLVVRHVPPTTGRITFPAAWMSTPVGSAPNNWAEVEKSANGKYQAQVGQESFQVTIRLASSSGRILSAVMENPVDVLERDCDDRALTVCGPSLRYRIRREIHLDQQLANALPPQ